jgi:hypothetical protein
MPPPPDADPLDLGEDGVDIARLGQTVAWGGLAAFALLVAVLAARSENGAQRIAAALHGGSAPTRSAAPPVGPPEAEKSEVARLAERVHALGVERERLAARLEALERTIDVTGSTRPPVPAAPTGNERVIPGVLPIPGPRSAPVLSSPSEAARPSATPGQPPATEAAPAGGPAISETTDRGEEAASAESAIDLGTGANLNELRALWRTVKAQHGGVLQGMWPLVAVRDGATGAAELRLVIGPVKDAATAARMCALIGLTGRFCQPGSFEGQRLALR